MSDFFSMGGYGAYVWPAYGVFSVIVVGLILRAAARGKAVREELDRLETRRGPKQD